MSPAAEVQSNTCCFYGGSLRHQKLEAEKSKYVKTAGVGEASGRTAAGALLLWQGALLVN